MQSWQVKLGKSWENNAGGLLSSSEQKGYRYQQAVAQQASKASYKMKSAPNNNDNTTHWEGAPAQQQMYNTSLFPSAQHAQPRGGLLGGSHSAVPPPPPGRDMIEVAQSRRNDAPAASFGGFGSSNNSMKESRKRASRLGAGLFGGGGNTRSEPADEEVVAESSKNYDLALADEDTADIDDGDGLDFEESVWEDNGLTANYELPGIRTLAPSSLARRHKIASLSATNIHLSHVCVPKLRSAAFLRAKIRNPSTSVTLLKGTAGVTLDGSFLGNMTLPRVSPSQLFSLPLGVDPAIQISYPKPNVHRSTSGFISRESAHTFNRSIWLTNTRPSAVELLVLDQVPVSQDERLRVQILQPRGLAKEGDTVRAGQAAKEGGKEVAATSGSVKEGAWGKATCILKKNGELNWNVNLEKGSACLLKLEYDTRMPSGETIVEV